MVDPKKERQRDKLENETEVGRDNNQPPQTDQEGFGEQFGNDYGFGREGEHVEEQKVPLNQGSDYLLRYDPPDYNEVTPVDESVETTKPELDDQQIIDTIYKRLGDDRQIDPKDIDVNITGGKVILVGKVQNQELKERAAQIAMTVPGVKTVDNQLTVY